MDATTGSKWTSGWGAATRGRRLAPVAVAAVALLVGAVAGFGGVAARGDGDGPVAFAAVGAQGAGGAFQPVPGERPSIAVLGAGEASAPAVGGRLQLIVRAVDPFAAAGEVPAPSAPPGQPPPLTEAQVRPVAAAIAAAGATARNVETVAGPAFGGPFGPGAAQILVDLDRTTLSLAEELVAAGVAAAGDNGLFVETVGAAFEAADCDALLAEARRAAADDARERAEGVAAAFGVDLGELLLASEVSVYGGGGDVGCAGPIPGPGAETYFPPFEASADPVVELYAQINAAYAIAG